MHRCRGSTTWRIPMALSHGGIYALQPLKFTVVHRLGGGDSFCWFWWVRLGWIAPWPKLGGGGVWWGVAGEEGWSSGSRVWCQGQAGCHCWWTSSNQPFPILVAARDGERRSQSSWSSDDRSRNVKQTVNHWVRGFWKVTKKQLWLCRLRQEWKIKAKVHENKNESCLSFHNIIIFFQVLTTRKHHKLLTLLKETQIWSHAKIILIIKEKKSCIRYMPKAAHIRAIPQGFYSSLSYKSTKTSDSVFRATQIQRLGFVSCVNTLVGSSAGCHPLQMFHPFDARPCPGGEAAVEMSPCCSLQP